MAVCNSLASIRSNDHRDICNSGDFSTQHSKTFPPHNAVLQCLFNQRRLRDVNKIAGYCAIILIRSLHTTSLSLSLSNDPRALKEFQASKVNDTPRCTTGMNNSYFPNHVANLQRHLKGYGCEGDCICRGEKKPMQSQLVNLFPSTNTMGEAAQNSFHIIRLVGRVPAVVKRVTTLEG